MKKRVLSLLLTLAMMVSLLPNAFAAKAPRFTDVGKDMWCFDYVEYVADKGYYKGTTATTFNPNGTMTRQQFVTVLARMAGVKVDNSVSAFSDVPAGSYSAGSVAWAVKEGIVTGYPDGTFKPTAPVTRQQMCAFMSRFMDYYAEAFGAYFLKKGTVSGFADADQIASYAVDAVDRCRTYGLILGYAEDNTFRPTKTATRAHVAAVIYRLAQVLQLAAGGGGEEPPTPETYTLNYKDSKAADEANKDRSVTKDLYAADSRVLPVEGAPTYALGAEFANLTFRYWNSEEYGTRNGDWAASTDAEKQALATINMTDDADKLATFTAEYADLNDYLFNAMEACVVYANSKQREESVKDYGFVFAPAVGLKNGDSDDAARELTVWGDAVLNPSNVAGDLVETATYYAVRYIADLTQITNENTEAVVTKTELREIVGEVLDLLDPNQAWWTGEGRTEKINNLVDKLYAELKDEGLEHGKAMWANFKKDGKPIITEVTLKDGNTVLATAQKDKSDVLKGMTAKRAVANVAKALATKMNANLKQYTDYVTDVKLAADLTLEFKMDTKVVGDPYGFSNIYNVTTVLNLVQEADANGEKLLSYKHANNTNYVKFTMTKFMQAEYLNNVEEMVKATMTNATLKTALTNAMTTQIENMVDAPNAQMEELLIQLVNYNVCANEAAAKTYVKDALLDVVDEWVEANLSTEKTPAGAPYVLPFDFFWNLGGTVNADGSLNVPARAAAPALGDNSDLMAAVTGIIDDVVASVASSEFDLDMNDLEGSIDTLLTNKINAKLDTATVSDLQTEVVNTAKSEMSTLKSEIRTEGIKVVKKAYQITYGKTPDEANTWWNTGLTETQKNEAIAEYLDVDAVLVDLFGTADPAALTIAKIDAAATYVPAPYADDVEAQIKNATTVEQLKALTDDIAEMIKDEISLTINNTIDTKVEGKLTDLINSNQLVEDMLGADPISRRYIKALVLNKLGFDSFIDLDELTVTGKTLKVQALENMADAAQELIDAEIATVVSPEEIESTLNAKVAEACGTYSKYLNKIGAVKTFDGLLPLKVQNFVTLLKNPTFQNNVPAGTTYLSKLATAISKIENNGSSIEIDGKVISNATLNEVKQAVKDGEMVGVCNALAEFLAPFADMSMNTFKTAEGVPMKVTAAIRNGSYVASANLVLEVTPNT